MRKHPIQCGFMCPLRIAITLGQVAHATSGVKSGGEGVGGHFGQNGQNSPKSGPSKYRISVSREKGAAGLCMDANPSFASPFATRVDVQSIKKAFLTPQSLKHTIYGKKCIYRRYWHEHIFGTLRSKNISKHFWSRPIVCAPKKCTLWLDCLRPLVSLVLAYERVCKEAMWHACSQGEII